MLGLRYSRQHQSSLLGRLGGTSSHSSFLSPTETLATTTTTSTSAASTAAPTPTDTLALHANLASHGSQPARSGGGTSGVAWLGTNSRSLELITLLRAPTATTTTNTTTTTTITTTNSDRSSLALPHAALSEGATKYISSGPAHWAAVNLGLCSGGVVVGVVGGDSHLSEPTPTTSTAGGTGSTAGAGGVASTAAASTVGYSPNTAHSRSHGSTATAAAAAATHSVVAHTAPQPRAVVPAHQQIRPMSSMSRKIAARAKKERPALAASSLSATEAQAASAAHSAERHHAVKHLDALNDPEYVASLPFLQRMAWKAAQLFGVNKPESRAIARAKPMVADIVALGEKEEFYKSVGLERSFHTWHVITFLHVWLVMNRLRLEDEPGAALTQAVFDELWVHIEDKIREYGMTQDFFVNRSVKSLLKAFYGSAVAYDEGILENDAILAAAVWRNFFGMKGSAREIASVVAYIHHEMARLQAIPPERFLDGHADWDKSVTPAQAAIL